MFALTFRNHPAESAEWFGRMTGPQKPEISSDRPQKPPLNWGFDGGPDWDRTSDLPRVRRTLSR
jgi:hypothetical protein